LNLTTHQLQYLVAVADGKTLSDAAEQLQISQSALSQGLSELERRLALPLFERRGRNRVLTDTGREVAAHCERILAATRDLTLWVQSTSAGSRGRVRLGLIDIAAVNYFPDALIAFRTRWPEVDLRLTIAPSAALTAQIQTGRLDAAVVVEPAEADHAQFDSLTFEPLLVEELAIYAPGPDRSDRAKLGPPSTWGPWVTFPAASHTRGHIAHALRSAGADFQVAAESNQPEVLRQLVSLGMGWTVLPVVQAEAEPNPLVRALREPLLTRSLVIARRSRTGPDPATDRLLDGLRAAALEPPTGHGPAR
jgi:DNA-binding transcriptional LysR family regulator